MKQNNLNKAPLSSVHPRIIMGQQLGLSFEQILPAIKYRYNCLVMDS